MGSYQAFELEELQADRSRSYAEFLRRPGVSMGIYHLPAGGKDPQHPHAADEVYVVLAGRAALEACGADMMYDCRRGECGLCQVKVLDVRGAIDHRDVFLSDAQHEKNDRLQCCVSRIVSPRTGGLMNGDGQGAEYGSVTIDVP